MEPKKYSLSQMVSIVDSEGLDYAILYHTSSDSIADPKLAKLWTLAGVVLRDIEKILDTATIKEEQIEV